MKVLTWILGIAALALLSFWAWRKLADMALADNARDKDEKAASIQATAKGRQAAASYGSILPASATFIRPNAALIDLNQLGGAIPSLYTLPRWSPVLAPNG